MKIPEARYPLNRQQDAKSLSLAVVNRAKQLIGYKPQTSFEKGLKNSIAWFRDNWDRIQAAARFGPGISSAVRTFVKNDR